MTEAGVKVRIRYVYEDVDRHGNVRVYVKPPGAGKVRVREEVGSPAFWARYNAILAGEAPAAPAEQSRPQRAAQGSLRWLIERYKESGEWRELGPRTRRVRGGLYDGICGVANSQGKPYGDLPYRHLQANHIAKRIRDEKADLPEAANGRVKALRQLFAWAMLPHVGLATDNPAAAVPYLKSKSDGFHTWTLPEVEAFVKRHPFGTKAFLAMALLLFTGVRRSDVVTLGRQMIQRHDGLPWLHFTEAKNQANKPKNRAVPVLPPLMTTIEATPSGHMTFLVTAFGKPFSVGGFGNWFRKRCNEADLPHCSAHGLRKAGATIAAMNGATTHQLMAIYGWESVKQAELYTRQANRIRLAGEAMHLLIPALSGERGSNRTFPLSEPVEEKWAERTEKANDINGGR